MPPDHGAAAVHIILEDAELRARWLVELDGDARPHQCGAPADRRGRSAPRFHRPPVRHVLDAAAVERSRCSSCARTTRSTWPTAAASTSSAWATIRSIDLSPPWSARWTRDVMADRDPGRVSAEVDWREVARLVLTSREMDRIEEQELVPAKKVLYQFSARAAMTWRRCCSGLQLKDGDAACGYYRSRPLLLALGVPLADALGSAWASPAAIRTGAISASCSTTPIPGGAHALPMCGGVGAQYTPAAGWAQAIDYKQQGAGRRAGGRDRAGARRRRELRDRWILVRANYCDDTIFAAAILRRGQWLRHLGAVGIPDAGQGHCHQSRELLRPDHFQRRRDRPGRGGAADPRGGRPCPRGSVPRRCFG